MALIPQAPRAPLLGRCLAIGPDNPLDLVECVILAIDRQLRWILREIDRIDDCLDLARGMDREGLAQVIELLRSARNEVVRQAGG